MERDLFSINQSADAAFYVFDIDAVKDRIRYLRRALPENTGLCYAVKANLLIAGELFDSVDRLELCSPGELSVCRKLGMPGAMAVVSGIYKNPADLELLIGDPAFDGIYTAESVAQYQALCALSARYGRRIPVLLRLTNDSQFGIDPEDIFQIVSDRQSQPQIDLRGIQFFSGTQKTSGKKLLREIRMLDDFLTQLETRFGYTAPELEYGTGFPVSYFEGETLDEEALFAAFSQGVAQMVNRPHITVELGRSIAACCGTYYTHVVDCKRNCAQNYAIVDGGMHQLVYFGQYMAMKHPFVSVLGKEEQAKTETYHICGSLCTMNDILVKQLPTPPLCVGDTLVFQNTGAYCVTEGIALFLTRDLPAVYLRRDGKYIRVRENIRTQQWNTPDYQNEGRMF